MDRDVKSFKAPEENTRTVALKKTEPVKEPEPNTRRIVLLGKSGSGKSSLANALIGEKLFKVSNAANSETKICQSEPKTINGRSLQLIDTPGFFDTGLNSTELNSELLKCITECSPGPHAFLLLFPLLRYTSQEEDVVDKMINQYFGEEALKYTTVVITHGDQLEEGQKIEEWVKENKSLKKLVDKCGGRCCVIDDKYWNNTQDQYRNNQNQIKELLKTIDQTVRENGGGCYTNEILQGVKKQIEMKTVIFKKSSPNMSEDILHKMAKEAVFKSLFSSLLNYDMKDVTVGAILGAFLGGVAGVALAQCLGASLLVTCVAGGTTAAVGVPVGVLVEALVSEYSEYHEPVTNALKDALAESEKKFKQLKFD